MLTKMFAVGMLSTNCYVASCKDTLKAIVVDPGFCSPREAEETLSYIKQNHLDVKYIVNTHGHPDHSCGNQVIKDQFNAQICIHTADAYMLGESGKETARYFGYDSTSPPADIILRDGDRVDFGNENLQVIHTPGHSLGSIILLGKEEVFTGDLLFAGSIGRTDFAGSSDPQMQVSLRKLLTLKNSLTVYPGHGPATTIGAEKQINPFLQLL